MPKQKQQRHRLRQFLIRNNMSIDERFPGCGFVYYDEQHTKEDRSGSVYWNLEEDSSGKTRLRLAVQYGHPSLELLERIRKVLLLWMRRA